MSCVMNPSLWIYLIWMIVGIGIAKIAIPWIISYFELPDPLGRIIMLILWGAIAVAGVIFLFGLLSCFFGGGGLSLPSFPTNGRRSELSPISPLWYLAIMR